MLQRILTGDRPTGQLHIGHYFGSLQDRVNLQYSFDTFILIADVQALTDNFEHPERVNKHVFEVVLDNLAVGINPEISTFVIQSMIPEIAELTVFYSNLVSVSRLEQNPTVKTEIKQKQALFKNSVSYGFLGYPISQAADITSFQAELVPVGNDQLPMLEQTREIVRKFNRMYGNTLREPQAKLGSFPRVKGLDGNKMSKSLNNAIFLADPPPIIQEKVLQAVTDPAKVKLRDKGNPDICTVFKYHQMFTSNLEDVRSECQSGSRGCVFCKRQLASHISKTLEPIREQREIYAQDTKRVKDIVFEGTQKAKAVAAKTLSQVKEAMQINYA